MPAEQQIVFIFYIIFSETACKADTQDYIETIWTWLYIQYPDFLYWAIRFSSYVRKREQICSIKEMYYTKKCTLLWKEKVRGVKLVGPKGSVLIWLLPHSIEPLTHGFLLSPANLALLSDLEPVAMPGFATTPLSVHRAMDSIKMSV